MKLHGTPELPFAPPERSVVTVGLFDGVHRGHRKVLEDLLRWARRARAEPVVITFERHPAGGTPSGGPPLIDAVEFRLYLIRSLGIERIWVLPLEPRVLAVEATEFLRQFVRKTLHGVGLLVGFNNTVGSDRLGYEALRPLGAREGVEVRLCPPVRLRGEIVSSTAVREAVQSGDLPRARALLGRPVVLFGRVVPGSGRGRRLGFPTANLLLEHEVVPPCGVYAGQTRLEGTPYLSAVSIGSCPTFAGPGAQPARGAFNAQEHRVEVHLIGYGGRWQGRAMAVAVTRRLRAEQRFPSREALVAQMKRDVAQVQSLRWDRTADFPEIPP